jgi:hypothetical protein
MIRLIDILREIAEEASPTPEEQKVIDDLLGSLQEGAFDSLLAKAKSYAKKGLLTATVIAALVASPELSSAQKSQVQKLPNATAQTTQPGSDARIDAILGTRDMNPKNEADIKRVDSSFMKWALGTTDDGILGQYTSQFKFPGSYKWTDPTTDTLVLHDTRSNAQLSKIGNLEQGKMEQWNAFAEWMKHTDINGKKISGNPALDVDSDLGQQVIDAYKQTKQGKNFWVSGEEDIKVVQRFIRAYRDFTIKDWKAGATNPKGGHTMIKMSK